MSDSALFGHPPNNQNDWFIVRGFARAASIPDKIFDPSKGFPSLVQRPPNFHYTSRGPGIIASATVTIFLIITITGTRLCLRFFRRDLKVGYDDYLVIPAALLTIALLAIVISLVTYGGAGKHIYDLTYQEFNWLLKVIVFPRSEVIRLILFGSSGRIDLHPCLLDGGRHDQTLHYLLQSSTDRPHIL